MNERAAHAADARIGVDRDLDVPELVALLRGRDEVLAAILDPFHRAAEQQRRERGDDLLLIEHEFRAEAAADVGRDHADLVLVAAEQIAEKAHRHMRRLRRAVDA